MIFGDLMGKRTWYNWYALTREEREKLYEIAPEFYELRKVMKFSSIEEEKEYKVIEGLINGVWHDFGMNELKTIMERGIKINIMPHNMQYLKVQFIIEKESRREKK